jgi:integrase
VSISSTEPWTSASRSFLGRDTVRSPRRPAASAPCPRPKWCSKPSPNTWALSQPVRTDRCSQRDSVVRTLTPTTAALIFKPAVARARLPESVTSHDLRHHYASLLLSAGESVVAVAARLGHENASLVLSTYGHLMPNTEDRTRAAIDSAWAGSHGPETAHEVDGG